jgi:hypothetical protein
MDCLPDGLIEGIFKDETPTREVMRVGWLRTGDLSGRDASSKEVIEFYREYLSAYKVPRIVEFVESLPR